MFFSKKVIEFSQNLENYGKIQNPDGEGEVISIVCGDSMSIYLKVDKDGLVTDAKFETFGCVAAMASGAVAVGLAKGKKIVDLLDFTQEDISSVLGGLPLPKAHCSFLATSALLEAIYDYLLKNKKSIPDKLEQKHQSLEQERKMAVEKFRNES